MFRRVLLTICLGLASGGFAVAQEHTAPMTTVSTSAPHAETAAPAAAAHASVGHAAGGPATPEAPPAAEAHGPASHVETKGHDGHEEHARHGPKVYGKPPTPPLGPGTDFLSISPQLFVWTLLMFLPLAWVMRKLAWEPILASLVKRDQRIRDSFAQAEKARDEARKLLEEGDQQMNQAQDKAKALLDEARAAAALEGEAVLASARKKAAEQQEAVRREIEAAKVEALAEIRGLARQLGGQMATKVAGRPIDGSNAADADLHAENEGASS